MAKREFVDRQIIIRKLTARNLGNPLPKWIELCFTQVPTITEQDIVKPYLEKLRADIDVAYYELDGYDPDSLATFASRVDDLIDNLLSQEVKNEL